MNRVVSRVGLGSSMVVVALMAMVALSGCILSYDPDAVELQNAASTEPRVLLLSPDPDEVVTNLVIELQVDNLTLVDNRTSANVDGEAHLVIFVGNTRIGDADGVITTTRIEVNGVDPGTTRVTVETNNNDGTAYEGIPTIIVDYEQS